MAEGWALAFDGVVTEAPRTQPRRIVLELVIGYGLILLTIWTPLRWQRVFYLLTLALILATTYRSFEGWRHMGFRLGSLGRSLWVVAVALVLAIVAALLAARLHTLHGPETVAQFFHRYSAYAIWAFFQQFLLLDYFLLRLLRVLRDRTLAVVIAAGLFAVAHLPNPILTPMTMLWGMAACLLFLRYRNLYPLGMAHAILGISIAVCVPGPLDHNMRVGLGYYTYNPHRYPHEDHRSQIDQRVSTDAWVKAAAPTLRLARQARP